MARRKKAPQITIAPDLLPPFEGRPVLYASLVIPNAGGGLRDALQVDPIEWHHGDEGFVLMRVRCRAIDFEPISKDDDSRLVRKHTVDAIETVLLDGKVAEPILAEHLDAVRVLVEKAKGVERLDYDGEIEGGGTEGADEGNED